jgi:hypothetical protein
MATIMVNKKSEEHIRVALIIEQGKIKPVWFEEVDKPGRDRIFIKQICSQWSSMEGTAKIINFAVWDGTNTYRLSLDTKEFTWKFGIVEENLFPPHPPASDRKY